MRILLVSHRFPPDDFGGVERYTEGLAAELVRAGDSVTIVTRRSQRGQKDIRMLRERLPDGTSLYRITAGVFSFEHFLDDCQIVEQLFTQAVLESSPEVVHINHLMGLSPRLIHIAQRLGAAVVVSLHDFYFVCPKVHLQKPDGELCAGPGDGRECVKTCFTSGSNSDYVRWGLRSLYFRRALAMAQRTICYSEYVGSYFKDVVPEGASIEILPNGVPDQPSYCVETSPDSDRQGTLNIAYCGTVSPHKGPHVILDALRIANFPSVNLIVIGHFPEQEYASRLRETARTIPGLTLRMYGKYERHELPFLLLDTDCVVVPSLVPEAGPIVPREALAQGVPVLAARLGALRELIREGENGFTFDSSEPAELAALLGRLAADETLRLRLRAGARLSAVITVAEHARRVRSVYESAIAEFNANQGKPADAMEFNFLHNALLDLGERTEISVKAPL
jgi:glycosyltransferase involved in cell wall biosynthesis